MNLFVARYSFLQQKYCVETCLSKVKHLIIRSDNTKKVIQKCLNAIKNQAIKYIYQEKFLEVPRICIFLKWASREKFQKFGLKCGL